MRDVGANNSISLPALAKRESDGPKRLRSQYVSGRGAEQVDNGDRQQGGYRGTWANLRPAHGYAIAWAGSR